MDADAANTKHRGLSRNEHSQIRRTTNDTEELHRTTQSRTIFPIVFWQRKVVSLGAVMR
jgi:hypothetical protein